MSHELNEVYGFGTRALSVGQNHSLIYDTALYIVSVHNILRTPVEPGYNDLLASGPRYPHKEAFAMSGSGQVVQYSGSQDIDGPHQKSLWFRDLLCCTVDMIISSVDLTSIIVNVSTLLPRVTL